MSNPQSITQAQNSLIAFETENASILDKHRHAKSNLQLAINNTLKFLARNPTPALVLADHRLRFTETEGQQVFDADGCHALKGWMHDENTLSVLWQEGWTEGETFEVRYSLLDIPAEYLQATH